MSFSPKFPDAKNSRYTVNFFTSIFTTPELYLSYSFKPMDLRHVVKPFREEFEVLFCETFSRAENMKFLNHIQVCSNVRYPIHSNAAVALSVSVLTLLTK